MPRDILFLVVGPSGTGKTTLVHALKERGIPEIVSLTTRSPRPGEVDGVHYRFVGRAEFEALRDAGEMIEWVEYNGNLYGSTKSAVSLSLAIGKGRAMVIVEGHGAQQYKRAMPGTCETLFLMPPPEAELRRRLEARGDAPRVVEQRLASVAKEMIYAVDADHVIWPGSPADVLGMALAIMGAAEASEARPASSGQASA